MAGSSRPVEVLRGRVGCPVHDDRKPGLTGTHRDSRQWLKRKPKCVASRESGAERRAILTGHLSAERLRPHLRWKADLLRTCHARMDHQHVAIGMDNAVVVCPD